MDGLKGMCRLRIISHAFGIVENALFVFSKTISQQVDRAMSVFYSGKISVAYGWRRFLCALNISTREMYQPGRFRIPQYSLD